MARRRGRKKANISSPDSVEANNQLDDPDDEAEVNKNQPKTATSNGTSPADDSLACPHCARTFTSAYGLKYHVDKKVCKKDSPMKKTTAEKVITSTSKKSSENDKNSRTLDDSSEKNQTKSNRKRSTKRKREEIVEESESEYDFEDSEEESDDDFEPSTKRGRTSKSTEKDSNLPEPNEDGKFTCPSCGKAFKSKLGIRQHIVNSVCVRVDKKCVRGKDGPKSRVCPKCKKSFTSKSGFKYHLENSVCSMELRGNVYNRPILLHVESEDDNQSEILRKSKKCTTLASGKTDNDGKDSECDDKSWNGASENESDDKTHQCPTCSKVFTSAYGLKYHLNKKVCTSSSSTVKREDKSGEGEINETHQCPTCSKVFTSAYGLKYHLNKKVCTSSSSTVKRENKSGEAENFSASIDHYLQVRPGSMFVTKFGVVKVIADDRLPQVHHNSKTPRKDAIRRFERNRKSFTSKQNDIAEIMYSGGRRRRENLEKMQASKGSLEASNVWSMYCSSITRNQILNDKMTWRDFNGDDNKGFEVDSFDQQDPRLPRDWFHERIVECELVGDEFNCIQNGSTSDTSPQTVAPKMRLFLARNELTNAYKNTKRHRCSSCGHSFDIENEWEEHITGKVCTTVLRAKQEERMTKLEAREENLDSDADNANFLSFLHAVMKQKVGNIEFGNPCRIKPHKKHKMPSWIVFSEEHTSMYPELFIALKFKRGSQNRNWAGKKKTAEDYVHGNDRKRERKARQKRVLKYEMMSSMDQEAAQHESANRKTKAKITVDMIHKFALEQAAKQEEAKKQGKYMTVTEQVHDFALKQAAQLKQAKTESKVDLPMPPLLPSIETADLVGENEFAECTNVFDSSATYDVEPLIEKQIDLSSVAKPKKRSRKKKAADETKRKSNLSSVPSQASDELTVPIIDNQTSDIATANLDKFALGTIPFDNNHCVKVSFKRGKKNPVVIDTQILVNECDGGRYPTISRFDGDHLTECVLCTRKDADDEDPLIDCDFCENTTHQICLNKRMLNKEPPIIIREQEPHDSLMCHDCMMYCIARRARAESRRNAKWHYELSKVGLSHPDAANLAEEVDLSKSAPNDAIDKAPTYAKCPYGGPGGLICCAHCSAAYSRFLSNTAKEMEAQSVAKVGQEMNEILDLLADAKQRLLNATDVSQANEIRRRLLRNNEV